MRLKFLRDGFCFKREMNNSGYMQYACEGFRLMRKSSLIIVLLITLTNCSDSVKSKAEPGTFFGREPPGIEARIFAPGVISSQYSERSITFSPDGTTVFYERWGRPWTKIIVEMKAVDGKWSEPKVAPFSGIPDFRDGSPFFSSDGNRVFFVSNRPVSEDEEIQEHSDIWMSRIQNGIWRTPVNLGKAVNSEQDDDYVSVARSGNIYFESNRGESTETYDIWFSRWDGDRYQEAERLPSPINTGYYEGHPCISPDEGYLIFTSDRPGELGSLDVWVSFKKEDETWSIPKNLGSEVNSTEHEAAPTLSPDGKYLFWMSTRLGEWPYEIRRYDMGEFEEILERPENGYNDIYWISTEVVHKLNPRRPE